jgi:hypothetical protein
MVAEILEAQHTVLKIIELVLLLAAMENVCIQLVDIGIL